MKLSQDLIWRNLIKDRTFKDLELLDQPGKFYLGIDASAGSLTVGNLAILLLARRLVDAGWTAYLLAGGATSLIGDPGGKAEERELKPREEIASNVEKIKAQIHRLFAGKVPEENFVDNFDWLKDVGYLEFLREVGKSFSMTELLGREFVKERLGEGAAGISYAEFSYSLVQGYDFWHLYKKHGVSLQIGGSDQWGNMLSGVALIRKKEAKEVNALSMPLVVDKTTGHKFGKSEAGAVWLDAAKTGPDEFYQFWINTTDEDVEPYLKVFTLLPQDRIEEVMSHHAAEPAKRIAQKCLADEVTAIVHGQDAQGASLEKGSTKGLQSFKLASGMALSAALVETGLAASGSEARRVIDEGGVYINDVPAKEETLEAGNYENSQLVLRRGKKLANSVLVELE